MAGTSEISSEDDQALLKAAELYKGNEEASKKQDSSCKTGSVPISPTAIDDINESHIPIKTRRSTQWTLKVRRNWVVFRLL